MRRSRFDAGPARGSPASRGHERRDSSIRRARRSLSGGRPSARSLVSSAVTPPMPTTITAPNVGSLRAPRISSRPSASVIIGWTSDAVDVGVGLGFSPATRRSANASRTASSPRTFVTTPPTSVLCVICGREDLQHDRIAEPARPSRRRRRACSRRAAGDRDVVGLEQRLGRRLGQHLAVLHQDRAEQVPRAGAVELEADGDRPRRLVQDLEVAGVGHEVHEGADGMLRASCRSGCRPPSSDSRRRRGRRRRPSRRPGPACASARAAASPTWAALPVGSVIACGVRIASAASTSGSSSTTAVASPNRSGGASPSTSTGLACDHDGGRCSSSRSIVSSASGASVPPRSSSVSSAITPGPPALRDDRQVRAPGRLRRGEQLGDVEDVLDVGDPLDARALETPRRRRRPPRPCAPVCDAAAWADAANRPDLKATIG